MGQSLMKFTPGADAHKEKEIGAKIEECYDKYFGGQHKEWNFTEFSRAISQTVEEINEKLGNTQFRVPSVEVLQKAYDNHHKGKGKNLKKEEFNMILREVMLNTGFTGFGSKDVIFYIFGIPAAALFIKNVVAPRAVPNEVFIPGVTSATVFLLSKLNKL
ncbi:hypothetical protein HS088_TW03G00621 [Tripterygium wilfordii]|uniref:Uncharacterized protein n=1 Tax=Tripterygium wilfordii TaxID=458696 RepID=A0A7J7DVE1_TRIWF|nr:hypothetical protein HS088_TW03G00621 [Tripterygium wilfordii]